MATSSDFEYMRLEREGKLAWLTFTRQRYLNAMNMAAAEELHRAATSIADDAEARILIVRGEGRAFSTGIDLKELAAGGTSMRYFRRWDEALRVFETMEKDSNRRSARLLPRRRVAARAGLRHPSEHSGLPVGAARYQGIADPRTRHLAPAQVHRLGTGQEDDPGGREHTGRRSPCHRPG